MADLTLSIANRAARNAASIALADAGDGRASVRLYDAQGTQLAAITLQKPCGSVSDVDGLITLLPDLMQQAVVQATGEAVRGAWCDGAGNILASGSAGAPGSDALFIVEGTISGDAMLYAGGAVTLVQPFILG